MSKKRQPKIGDIIMVRCGYCKNGKRGRGKCSFCHGKGKHQAVCC